MDNQIAAVREVGNLFSSGFRIIDFEMTAPSDDPNVDIVEVSVLTHIGEVLLEQQVRPTRPISPAAHTIHGLQNSDLISKPQFQEIYPQLAELLKDRVLVAYGAQSEQELLAITGRRYHLPPPAPLSWVDAARLYAAYRTSDQFFSLTEACIQEGIPVENRHTALGDCRLTLALLKKVASAGRMI